MLSRLGGACSGCVVPGAFTADVLVLAPGAKGTNPLGIKFGAYVGRPGPENAFEFGWPSSLQLLGQLVLEPPDNLPPNGIGHCTQSRGEAVLLCP